MTAGPAGDDRPALNRAGDSRRPGFLRHARSYARHRVARGLDGLWVSGLDGARTALAGGPVLFVSNHVAWWDSLLLVVLDEALGGVGWAVMDAASLRRLPFLGWLGGLPLDRSSPERSRDCLRADVALLDRPGRALWFFPQGRQRPAHLRPLGLRHGLVDMHAHNPVDIVVVSLDYVFLERDRPAAVVRFAPPIPGSALGAGVLPAVESAILDGLTDIDRAAMAATDGRRARTHPADPLPGFVPLLRPRGSGTPDGIGSRMLRVIGRRGSHAR